MDKDPVHWGKQTRDHLLVKTGCQKVRPNKDFKFLLELQVCNLLIFKLCTFFVNLFSFSFSNARKKWGMPFFLIAWNLEFRKVWRQLPLSSFTFMGQILVISCCWHRQCELKISHTFRQAKILCWVLTTSPRYIGAKLLMVLPYSRVGLS